MIHQIPSYPIRPLRFFEEVCAQGECLHLRPQQRLPPPPANKVMVLREGMLAIDAMPAKGKLQVLDFLVAADVVSATILPLPAFRCGQSPAHRSSPWIPPGFVRRRRSKTIVRLWSASVLSRCPESTFIN